jgi:hypothetical protein
MGMIPEIPEFSMEKREKSELLDNLYIAAPCGISWESMEGDDRKRLCGGCSRHVFNISDMTKAEANNFLEENGTSQCMIFFRRQDGTIMTDNCPVGLRKIRDRAKLVVRAAASAFALLLSSTAAFADKTVSSRAAANQRGNCVAPGPAPPGFAYQGNPAGGGMILVPQKPVKVVKPNKVDKPDKPDKPDKTELPLTNPNIDPAAMEFFTKGQAAMTAGKKTLAEFYFDKALTAFDKQKGGDAKFRQLIDSSLKKAQAK